MLYLYFLLKGLITGITIAAIGGPVGLLCIRQSVQHGASFGIALGFGAALADALFGSIAGFGLTMISNVLLRYQMQVNILGCFFLLYLGITTLLEKVQSTSITTKKDNLIQTAATAFLITLTNPATILFFTAISVSLGIGLNNYIAATTMVCGIFCGSVLWFTGIAYASAILHTKITPSQLNIINKIFGCCLIIFGLSVGIKALMM